MTEPAVSARILIIDDQRDMATTLADYLGDHGYDTLAVTRGTDALEALQQSSFDAVITDLRMPGMDGLTLLDSIRARDPRIPVFVMTAFGTVESAIDAVKRGAYHYFSKPLKADEVLVYLQRALEHRRAAVAARELLRDAQERYTFESMVGRSAGMRHVFDLIDRVADSSAAVLIRGESGTGKELIARAIHFRGVRAARAFVPVNCAAIPATLLESELFGYEKGAFTGAGKARAGLAVEASGGTLFLDEIGDMPMDLQPKLLRLIQEGEVRPVGSDSTRRVDVRVLAATHADVETLVDEGRFRKDLFYRLNVVPIEVPPLRDRPEDIPILAERLLGRVQEVNPRLSGLHLGANAVDALLRYDWPGNVRELENAIERAATLCRGESIRASDLEFLGAKSASTTVLPATEQWVTLKEMERRYIDRVLDHVGGSKVRAAAILGIDPSTIYRRSKRQ